MRHCVTLLHASLCYTVTVLLYMHTCKHRVTHCVPVHVYMPHVCHTPVGLLPHICRANWRLMWQASKQHFSGAHMWFQPHCTYFIYIYIHIYIYIWIYKYIYYIHIHKYTYYINICTYRLHIYICIDKHIHYTYIYIYLSILLSLLTYMADNM